MRPPPGKSQAIACRDVIRVALLWGLSVIAPAQEVQLTCDTTLGWGELSERGSRAAQHQQRLQGRSRTLQIIDTAALTITSAPNTRDEIHRIGTRQATRECGPYTFIFSSGWFNSNPLGEMGADGFAVFEVDRDGKRVLGPLALGACGYGGLSWGRCPADWVTSLTFEWGGHRSRPAFYLERAFQGRYEAQP